MDVDNVCADFTGHYVAIANRVTGRFYKYENVTEWEIDKALGLEPWAVREIREVLSRPGAAHNVPECPGSVESILKISRDVDIVFVTSPLTTSKTWAHDRAEWLFQKFGEIGRRVIHTEHKECVLGDMLVDDKPENVARWSEHVGGLPVLWDQPSNRFYQEAPPIRRLHNWDEVISAVSRL
jgi:5'(3')-deoxyribonucleotidase